MKSNYNSRKIKPLSEIFSDQMFLTVKPIITFYIYELVLHGKLANYTAGNPIYSFERLTDDELKRLTNSPNLSVEIFTIKIPTDEFKKNYKAKRDRYK
jgi:hypothetical protein